MALHSESDIVRDLSQRPAVCQDCIHYDVDYLGMEGFAPICLMGHPMTSATCADQERAR